MAAEIQKISGCHFFFLHTSTRLDMDRENSIKLDQIRQSPILYYSKVLKFVIKSVNLTYI